VSSDKKGPVGRECLDGRIVWRKRREDGSEAGITEYVREQGRKPEEYRKRYDEKQLKLFQTR
jgi:hypothetical protein